MKQFTTDLLYCLRDLRRNPGFALTAIFSLALGIGATSAVFSVIHAVLINPFPYPASERLAAVTLKDKAGRFRYPGFNGPQLDQIRQAKCIDSVVAEDGWNLTTTDGDLPEDVQAAYISTNAASHWGIPAMMGRWFIPSDGPPGEEPQRVIVLSYRFWQRYYGGDPNVVGRKIQLVRKNYTILGVMPPRYRWREADIYVPLKVTSSPSTFFGSTMRIKPGCTPEQTASELQPLIDQFAAAAPERYPDKFQVTMRNIIESYAKPIGPKLYLLLGAVGSLLLIGCANVSILLLARGAKREQELAVRSALGAKRSRLIAQLLTESAVIALAGASLGVLFAWRSLALLIAWIPANSYPAESVIEMNLPVLAFSVGIALAAVFIFGLAPAVRLSRPDLGRVIQSSSRRLMGNAQHKRSHNLLIGAQVALTLVMLTVAGAAAKGFMKLVQADLGYDPRMTMSLPIPVHENTYSTWAERSQYFEQIRSRIAGLPQVVSAGISVNATPPANGWEYRVELAGRDGTDKPAVRINFVSPEYFEVLRIPLVEGRHWTRAETTRGATLALVNQTMARQLWPKQNAIGQRFRIPGIKSEPPYRPSAEGAEGWIEVVGVVADARNDGLRNPTKPGVFVPYNLTMRMFTQILVRTKVSPLSLLKQMRSEIVQIDREQQIMQVRDLEGWITNLQEYAQQRLVAMLFVIFSVMALILAAAGLYSVVAYSVATRTNEFGIRVALGAHSSDILKLVLSSTFINVGAGVAAGIALSLLFDSLASHWVTESSRDPWILLGVTVLLTAVAALSCWLPARRAAAVDPMEALRYD